MNTWRIWTFVSFHFNHNQRLSEFHPTGCRKLLKRQLINEMARELRHSIQKTQTRKHIQAVIGVKKLNNIKVLSWNLLGNEITICMLMNLLRPIEAGEEEISSDMFGLSFEFATWAKVKHA